jgi:hypothetical protein
VFAYPRSTIRHRRPVSAKFLAVTGVFAVLIAVSAPGRAAWQTTQIKQGDGRGGVVQYPAQKQAVAAPGCTKNLPFGLVQMDNGKIAMIMSVGNSSTPEHPVMAFSSNGGQDWSGFQSLPTTGTSSAGRPMMLDYLGGGKLSYVSAGRRYFSNDYGQTWPSSVAVQNVKGAYGANCEGNDGIDRDSSGNATRVMEVDYYWPNGEMAGYPQAATNAVFRYSTNEGRSWTGEVQPPAWKYNVSYKGQTYQRGVSEGSVVRAANGNLVAALRTDMPPRFYVDGGPNNDNLEGTGVSISHDNGATWSAVNVLFDAGRHHANLQRLPNDDLLMTVIVRDDIRTGGGLTTHNRGCDALLSHDNGATWNLDQRITLDEFNYYNSSDWLDGQCGHLGSAVLSDGSVLTAYGKYLNGTAVLIKWNPEALAVPEPSACALAATGLLGWLVHALRRRR